jgi:hypothetical protein
MNSLGANALIISPIALVLLSLLSMVLYANPRGSLERALGFVLIACLIITGLAESGLIYFLLHMPGG